MNLLELGLWQSVYPAAKQASKRVHMQFEIQLGSFNFNYFSFFIWKIFVEKWNNSLSEAILYDSIGNPDKDEFLVYMYVKNQNCMLTACIS